MSSLWTFCKDFLRTVKEKKKKERKKKIKNKTKL